jgi:hypothetical protein
MIVAGFSVGAGRLFFFDMDFVRYGFGFPALVRTVFNEEFLDSEASATKLPSIY